MIQFQKVSKRYAGNQDAIHDVSFHLKKGEMAFLTGHSGAGKSTLLKLITGLEHCSRGQIIVNDTDLNRIQAKQIPQLRRNIGIIFQDPKLLHDRTIFDNVALPLVIAGFRYQEIRRRVRAALSKVGLLGKEAMYPTALSGGEQQRVGIARAIVNKPPLILADEPTGNLDPGLSAGIMRLFQQLNQVGVTVMIASHDLALIATLKHRIMTLRKGQLVNDGKSLI